MFFIFDPILDDVWESDHVCIIYQSNFGTSVQCEALKTDVFCLNRVSFKVFIPAQRQMRTLYYVCLCLLKCVANHIISPHGCGQKADGFGPVPHPFLPEPALSFPSPSFRLFAPSTLATETLMTSLTPNPSVGNYNICRHERAAHKDGPGTGVTLPPPRLCLDSGCRESGAMQRCWGRVGGRGGGDHFVQ